MRRFRRLRAVLLLAPLLGSPCRADAQTWLRATVTVLSDSTRDTGPLTAPAVASTSQTDTRPTPYGNTFSGTAWASARYGLLDGQVDSWTTDGNDNGESYAFADEEFSDELHVVSDTLPPGTLVTIRATLAGSASVTAAGYDSWGYNVGASAIFTCTHTQDHFQTYAHYGTTGLLGGTGQVTFQVAVGDSFQAAAELQLLSTAAYGSVAAPSSSHADCGGGFRCALDALTPGALLVSGSCASWGLAAQPAFSSQPATQAAAPGSAVTFTAASARYGPYTWQWRRDGVPLADAGEFSGTRTPALHISPVGPADDARYDVVVGATCANDTSDAARLLVNTSAGVPPGAAAELALGDASPNPARDAAAFGLVVPRPMTVRVEIVDLAGRRIAILADGPLPAGRFTLRWDGETATGTRAAPGLYRCRLVGDSRTAGSRSLVLVR